MLIHVVKKGDLLWEIAEKYKIGINDIIKVNEILNPNLLLEGQVLMIPNPGIFYQVKYGDTLWDIANHFGVSLSELISINKIINPNFIYPGLTLTIPQKRKPPLEVNAFTYVFGLNDVQILKDSIDYLTYLTPFSYIVNEDGRLTLLNDLPAIQYALSNNVIPIMSIANFSYNNSGEDLAHEVLNDMEKINILIDNILYIMKLKEYRGLRVYFENIPPNDREAYSNFLFLLANKLQESGYFISVVLPPKYSDEVEKYRAYDYKTFSQITDFVAIKNFELFWMEEEPGAAMPVEELIKTLNYAVSLMPSDKIILGIQIVARDWVLPHKEDMKAEVISMQEAMNRAYRYNAQILYDKNSQAPYFFYHDIMGRKHVIWFEDARSILAKFDIIKQYGLRGISLWILGYPFPQIWDLIEENFKIIKE